LKASLAKEKLATERLSAERGSVITIPVSVGELIDKITILTIKIDKFRDPEKKQNCLREYGALTKIAEERNCSFPEDSETLLKINEKLWDIENSIRLKALTGQFDDEFIELAKQCFQTNEQRAKIKRRINAKANSEYKEEKEYIGFDDVA